MSRLKLKADGKLRRAYRTRAVLRRQAKRPRLSVHVSNRHVLAQIIDDQKGVTLVAASTTSSGAAKGAMSERAAAVGKEIAKKAKAKKINEVAFDRGPKLYHGRIKALADAARKEGLKF